MNNEDTYIAIIEDSPSNGPIIDSRDARELIVQFTVPLGKSKLFDAIIEERNYIFCELYHISLIDPSHGHVLPIENQAPSTLHFKSKDGVCVHCEVSIRFKVPDGLQSYNSGALFTFTIRPSLRGLKSQKFCFELINTHWESLEESEFQRKKSVDVSD